MITNSKLCAICTIVILAIGYTSTPVGALDTSVTNYQKHKLEFLSNTVENEQPGSLLKLDIENLISLQIVQQPIGNGNYVTSLPDTLTEYQIASDYGTIGLLAHNYLAGQYFFQILPGQEIELVHRDYRTERFVVTHIQQYQALVPNSPSSDFTDLATGEYLTALQLFGKIYRNKTGTLILQTCIYADQNPTWGRLFIVAEPVTQTTIVDSLRDIIQ